LLPAPTTHLRTNDPSPAPTTRPLFPPDMHPWTLVSGCSSTRRRPLRDPRSGGAFSGRKSDRNGSNSPARVPGRIGGQLRPTRRPRDSQLDSPTRGPTPGQRQNRLTTDLVSTKLAL